jgi:hypothetical protein
MRPAQGRQAKTYDCPICHGLLLAMNPNTLLFPEGDRERSSSCPYRLRGQTAGGRQAVDQVGVGTVVPTSQVCEALVVAPIVRVPLVGAARRGSRRCRRTVTDRDIPRGPTPRLTADQDVLDSAVGSTPNCGGVTQAESPHPRDPLFTSSDAPRLDDCHHPAASFTRAGRCDQTSMTPAFSSTTATQPPVARLMSP